MTTQDQENMNNINPQHYQKHGRECIDVMQDLGVDLKHLCLGNVIKYLYRYNNKGGSEDLEKAEWYLKRLITEVKAEEIFGENESIQA